MNLLLLLFRSSRIIVVAATLASLVGGLSTVGVLIFVRGWMTGASGGDSTPYLVWGFVGVCLGALLSKFVAQLLLIGLSRRAVARLTMQLSERILAAPLKRLEHLGPTRLEMAVTHDIPAIVQGLSAIPLFCANIAIVAACLGYLAVVSLPAFLVVAAVFAVGVPIQLLILFRARRHFDRSREGQEGMQGQLRHLLDGVKELKLHGPRREAFLSQSLQASVEGQEKQGFRRQFYHALASAWGRMLLFALLGILLIGLPAFVPTDAKLLGTYVLAVLFLMQPLGNLKAQAPQMSQARSALDRVQRLGVDLLTAAERGGRKPAPPIASWQKLELAGVTFFHRGERDEPGFSIGPIDMTFTPGELVFVGGGNGSGKTTFAKLLIGLYFPHEGEIRLDGDQVTRLGLERYRQLFTVVFSEFHLFPSLFGLGEPELEAKAREYLQLFHLDSRVTIQNGAFSTTTRLSRGQRKRLALLVAYLEDRPFYVFDEWAADQDPHFKQVFYTQLLPELKQRGKTVVAITHDDRYYHVADRLLLLEEGKLSDCSASAGRIE